MIHTFSVFTTQFVSADDGSNRFGEFCIIQLLLLSPLLNIGTVKRIQANQGEVIPGGNLS